MLYRWIFLDADNTLLDFDRAERYALEGALAEAGYPYREDYLLEYHAINYACWRAYEAGELDRDRLRIVRFEQLLAHLGTHVERPLAMAQRLADAYMQRLSETDFLIHEAIEILEALQGSAGLVMVTNGLSEVQWPRLRRSGLEPFFEQVVIADEIGVSKPHPDFFEQAFAHIGHPQPEEVLMVGDNLLADIEGAQAYGMDTCWFNPGDVDNRSGIFPTYEIRALRELPRLLFG